MEAELAHVSLPGAALLEERVVVAFMDRSLSSQTLGGQTDDLESGVRREPRIARHPCGATCGSSHRGVAPFSRVSERARGLPWTPIHLWLQLSPDYDQMAALDCRVGELGGGSSGLVRIPYAFPGVDEIFLRLPERIESIQWAYRAVRQ